MKNNSRSSRPTLGFLVDWLEEDYQQAVFGGIVDTAVQRECNLLCFAGGGLKSPNRLGLERNFIYDLAGPDTVDAVLVMGGSVGHAVGLEGVRQFCEKYRPLPMCSIALEIPNVPSVLVDNARGMHDAILHLIMHHGFRRLAFIRGPETNDEAERRFGVYREVLQQHSIAFDPSLVVVGDFQRSSGVTAARQLCSVRPLPFDAILAASDIMALGAMDALAELGIKVPDDMAVVGFDDVVEARFALPPLTTVRQPLYEQGARATEGVLEQLKGGHCPLRSTLLTEIVLRRSCGCFSQSAMAYQDSLIPFERLHAMHTVEQVRPLALSAMQHAARGLRVTGFGWNSRLFDALLHDLEGAEGPKFLAELEGLLHLDVAKGSDASAWHDVITALRGQLLPCLPLQHATRSIAESLLQHARLLVTSVVERIHVQHRLEAEQWVRVLSETNEAVITTFDIGALTRSVADQLPRLGIQSCYLALFEPSSEEQLARLIMAYDALAATPPVLDSRPFQAKHLLPSGMFPGSRRVSFIVEPLFFRQQRLGFALFEMGPRQGIIYEALRDQISAALKGAMLVQEVVDKNRELESAYVALKENQEKLLVSEKTAGIGRLTASIAHEMNSPVAAVRAALLELEKLIAEYNDSAADAQVTVADHHEIATEMSKALRLATSAAERAADFVRSIKNQTRDTGKKERIRFDAVASVRESLLLLGHLLRKANCSVRVSSSADVIHLVGPPGRLGQVVTNLVTNAIDAMAPTGGGAIDLSLIKSDDRITLCVSDHGCGVPEEIRERIWDPLFTTKPFGQGTGLGLTIVRDIVAGDFGGNVELEPRTDGGSSFRVVLPTSAGDGA
jgi:DNA-binding LacI/PurR family transcriptional regulator/C4-dicarboxylate-specific signal transduction histidine kinase